MVHCLAPVWQSDAILLWILIYLCVEYHLLNTLTEQNQALTEQNQALTEKSKKAENASQAKSAFLASVSHELRTPMNALILYTEYTQAELKSRRIHDLADELDRALASGRSLLSLIEDVLDLAKIEAGKLELSIEEFRVEQVLQDVMNQMQPLVNKNENTLYMEVYETLGLMKNDGKRLRQILINLIANAAKFTNGGQIFLRAELLPSNQIAFEVEDTGIGMSEEQLKRIFQDFEQATPTTSKTYGGSGLGLALCRKFAHLMHGQITVTSSENQGSKFRLELPRTLVR
jgi:signal transduction histidine kinase